ncbi:N-acetylmuramic acid 6-phosphate etherase [Biomaibacter acetigenes]|uniref:N-acetylmuramic acid 6-phosphate etherase n=1 Tax=Biomaibacter acetigenes TaxID=2316383 RepID=A0A3G2R7M8_9FIRM|nr:N-acetylmuramic acid 6-phosphate etherase [Biomaibacter acetigenes]AYO31534.1 N-acetylmuramic acid 6-phosphate etherase [Biomaibacter acetigenes]
MDLAKLVTEGRNPDTMDIDMLETKEMLKKINNEDKKVPLAVEKEIPNIAKAVDVIAQRLREGGRLFYIGAGTSGRLGVLDASECPPTYGVDPEMVQGIIAGGDTAIRKSMEGVEDDAGQGKIDLMGKNLSSKDAVVGLAASGRTPYVLGAMEYARSIGVLTVGICCTPENLMEKYADIMITPVVGPEVITGSTRMKAGTAQKLVLNMISTGVMIKLGKVYSNLMVDVRATNEKLVQRARRIVKQATGAGEDIIEKALEETEFNVKLAIVMIFTGLRKDEAEKLLEKNEGHIRKAIDAVV